MYVAQGIIYLVCNDGLDEDEARQDLMQAVYVVTNVDVTNQKRAADITERIDTRLKDYDCNDAPAVAPNMKDLMYDYDRRQEANHNLFVTLAEYEALIAIKAANHSISDN